MAWMICPECGAFLTDNFNTVPKYNCACGYTNQSVTYTTNIVQKFYPKSYLAIITPSSCKECQLYDSYGGRCYGVGRLNDHYDIENSRAPFCPLQIIDEKPKFVLNVKDVLRKLCPIYTEKVYCPHYHEYSCPAYADCPELEQKK